MSHLLTEIAEVVGALMLAGSTVFLALIAARLVNLWRLRRAIDREVRAMIEAELLREDWEQARRRELAAVIQLSERRPS